MVKLHGISKCPLIHKICLVGRIVGIPIELVEITEDGCCGKSCSFPVIETPEGCVYGSGPILRYLIQNGDKELSRGAMFSNEPHWMSDTSHEYIHDKLERPLYCWKLVPSNIEDILACLSKHLTKYTYFGGDLCSYADVAGYLAMLHLDEKLYSPEIKRWMATMANMKELAEGLKAYEPIKKVIARGSGPCQVQAAGESKPKISDLANRISAVTEAWGDHYLDSATFVLENFKRVYGNWMDKAAANFRQMQFDTTFKSSGWSFWFMKYEKLEDECKIDFVTCNQLKGFAQRVDPAVPKQAVAVLHVVGEKGNYDIQGVWLCQGDTLPASLEEHPSFGFHSWRKLDPSQPEDREIIDTNFFYKHGDNIQGRDVVETVHVR